MNKLKLSLESLTVESFDTTTSEKARGTVVGEQCTCPTACTCPGCPTCDETCPNTCVWTCDDPSCGGTCPGEASCDDTCGGNSYCWCLSEYETCRPRLCPRDPYA